MDDDNKDGGNKNGFFGGGFPPFGSFGGFDIFFRDMEKSFQDSFFQDMFKDMESQFEDMGKNMEDGFKNSGDMSSGFHPPGMSGSPPPMNQNPRDQMLKGTDGEDSTVSKTRPFDRGNMGSWRPKGSSLSQQDNSDNHVSFRFRQTIRHGDGTVEQIEKTTKDGRTCTTVTKTDPEGVSTTTTTCDRPAIDGATLLSSDDTQKPSGWAPFDNRNLPIMNPEPANEGTSFFSALLRSFGFKPKS